MKAKNRNLAMLLGSDGSVVIPRAFAALMGSLDGGAVLLDMVLWQDTYGSWFWRVDATIAEQYHIRPYVVKRSRDLMTSMGWLKQKMKGVPAKAHYEVDLDAVFEAVAKLNTGTHDVPPVPAPALKNF